MSTPNEPGTPEPSTPEPSVTAAAEETAAQREPRRTRVGAILRHRATAIVGAALAGLLIGGGVVAAIDGPGDRGPGGGYRGHHELPHQPGPGPNWFGDGER